MEFFTQLRRSEHTSSLTSIVIFQVFICLFLICCTLSLKADCLIPNGSIVYASDDPFNDCSGAIVIKGILIMDTDYDLSSYSITNLIIDGGLIEWGSNSDLGLPNVPLILRGAGSIAPSGSGGACNSNKTITFAGTQYASCNGNSIYSSFAEINGHSGANFSTQLPVELTFFDGYSQDNKVYLEWETATELNNDYFSVEHSLDGKSFLSLGLIEGKGTTQISSIYHFEDTQRQSGIHYYRLRQVDLDGTSNYHGVIVVEIEESTNFPEVNIWPNPAKDHFYVSAEHKEGKIELYSSQRQLIFTQNMTGEQSRVVLPKNLMPGLYILRWVDGRSNVTRSIIIQ